MHEHPSLSELVTAVKSFLQTTAQPNLTGHAAFHARVAANVLDIVIRELSIGDQAQASERARLLALLGSSTTEDVSELNRRLCTAIRAGEQTPGTPGLMDHLKTTAIDQLKIDQPGYSGLKHDDKDAS